MAHEDEVHEHDRGLSYDLPNLLSRRRALTMLGGAGLLALVGCADESGSGSAASPSASTSAGSTSPGSTGAGSTSSGSTTTTSTEEIPEETGGPFPADGSNGVNVLTQSGIVRSDITSSLAPATGVAQGVPLTIRLKVLDVSNGAAPLAGAAVYLWHCDREGRYSLYSQGVTEESYLRGVQAAGSDGSLTFTSIFPAAYSGRWPHIHFEVYPSVAQATSASGRMRTSQLALPEDVCREVYATDGYSNSLRNLEQTSLDGDNVFRDGYSLQLATVTGSIDGGMTATLNVPV